ncbi:MAG: hypothetical protein QM708_13400 [Propioniciclava sp.]|uniref:hypothetical protein n=1 Tax=Propioniciclava sp. TaxID=2038686 RepID=UPI0039E6FFE3
MNRTLNVVRMQLVNRQTFIWIPLIVLAGAFAITMAIHLAITSLGGEVQIYLGAQTPMWYFAIVGAQSLTLTFPFAQAMSVTRREFHLGTLLTTALTTLVLTALMMAGALVELATGGWGMDAFFFYTPALWGGHVLVAGLGYFTLTMLFFSFGFWGATIYKRFGGVALTTTLVALALAIVGGLWVAGRLNAWSQLGAWFVAQGVLGLSLWGLLLIAALAAISSVSLRRAVP